MRRLTASSTAATVQLMAAARVSPSHELVKAVWTSTISTASQRAASSHTHHRRLRIVIVW